MPAPYSQDLRQRVIGFMALGGSARAAAARFDVSVSSATRWAQRWRAEGHARPRAMGGDRRCRLREHSAKVLQLVARQPDLTLQEIRSAQQTLSEIAAHGVPTEVKSRSAADVATFLQSLSSAWTEGEVRPTHRKQPKAKHWWRTRTDPFADAWPVIEGWLIAEPSIAPKALMNRLVAMVPEIYDGKAQLRTLQRRVKAWRSERVTEMVLGGLCRTAAEPAEV